MPNKEKPKFQFMEKAIQYLQKEGTLQQIHHYVIDPLLNHILDRVFPYIVITCVLFCLILILVMGTFAIVLLQVRNASKGSSIVPFLE
jgi:hypothetical protein